MADYPSSRWFWRHVDKAGRKRALAELWVLRRWQPTGRDEAFWRIGEIGRIEGNLDVPERLSRPSAELLAEVEAAIQRRLAAWMAWSHGAIEARHKRRFVPDENG